MEDIWHTFPAQMGDDQAWITYNHGFAEVAEADKRGNCLRVRVTIKNPTEYGMPTNEEFPALSSLDESIDDAITAAGGVYVGRITVAGCRFFYYYAEGPEDKITGLVDMAATLATYEVQYLWEPDPENKRYWDELYPTLDDWRVIQDLGVLETLSESGDNKSRSRKVTHWAYFPTNQSSTSFKSWVFQQEYELIHSGPVEKEDGDDENQEYVVQFGHSGTMNLGDITHHTIGSDRKARELGGRYDGWETSVET